MKRIQNVLTKYQALTYLLPSLLFIFTIIMFPIIYTFYISFTNMNIYNWYSFSIIGFRNYRQALFHFDSGFIEAILNTIVWTVFNMTTQLVIAFIIANLLNKKSLTMRNVYKTLLMIPWAIPGYVSILLWKTGMFNTQFGLLNKILQSFGISPIDWLNDTTISFFSMSTVNLWLALPFMTMIMDGALQSIDKSYYEVAILETKSRFKKARYITIPLILPVIFPAVIITIFTTFKQFDIIYLLILQPSSRTGSNFNTIITYAYENAFITSNYGYSSAISIIIFTLLISLTLLFNKQMRGEH